MPVTVETIGPAPIDPRARQFMVPMRDGVRLATDVYLPDGAGPFAAVLVRLPYDKDGRYCWMPSIARHVTARGYAFVPQDVRGKFRSEGDPVAFVGEVPTPTTRSTGSRSSPGATATSACGATATTASRSGRPWPRSIRALKAIVPRVTIADIDSWLEGVTPLYGAHYLAEYWTDHATNEWTVDWSRRPLAAVFDDAFEAIGQPLGVVRLRPRALARRRPRRAVPGRPPVRRPADPDAPRRGLVRQHHPAAHARLRDA